MSIRQKFSKLRADTPDHVRIVVAAKTRSVEEVRELIEAGATDIGENYVQEAETMRQALGTLADSVRWHLIGHLQTNKVNKALAVFDTIQTLDSLKLARAIDKRAGRRVPVLIEINSGCEENKAGVMPGEAEALVREVARLDHVRVRGLMTMGPVFGRPEDSRPYYRETKRLFDLIAGLEIPGVTMEDLSMGMSNAYRIAIEEGATLIRPGTILFGERGK